MERRKRTEEEIGMLEKERVINAVEEEKNAPIVKEMTIAIIWKKRQWDINPYLTAHVIFENGQEEMSPNYTCNGCGYDKLSTVMADLFNDYMKSALWKINLDKFPYGISSYVDHDVERRYFCGAVGIACYYRIAETLGYKLDRVICNDGLDVFRLYRKD